MRNLNKFFILFFSIVFLVACGGSKGLDGREGNAKRKDVIERNKATEPSFKTLQGRLRGSYDDGEESQSISVSIRMEKDKTIWLSAKLAGIIPLAKVLIEPDRVQFYEKINGQYFDGDFSLLSNWLGTELDFEKVQNLLIGQPVYELEKSFQFSSTQNGYKLASLEQNPMAKSFLIDLLSYRTKAQQLVREEKGESVTITYNGFFGKEDYFMPKGITIVAIQKDSNTKINIDYRSLEFNEPVSFPFEIPSGYDEITIE